MKRNAYAVVGAIAGAAAAIWLGARVWRAARLALWAFAVAGLASGSVEKLSRKMGRTFAAILVLAGALLLGAGIFGAILVPAVSRLGRFQELARPAYETLEKLSRAEIGGIRLGAFSGASLSDIGTRALTAAADAVSELASGFAGLAAVFALAVFYLADWPRLTLRLSLMVPGAYRGKALSAAKAVKSDLGLYFRGQLIVMALVGALASAVLWIIKAPMPLAMGAMYGALNAIPYVGPLIATIPPVLAALGESWKKALFTLGALLLVQQADNNLISPRVMGASSGAGPASVILAISVGSALAGVKGMFLALPALVSARALYRVFVVQKESLSEDLSDG